MKRKKSISDKLKKMSEKELKRRVIRLYIEIMITKAVINKKRIFTYREYLPDLDLYDKMHDIFWNLYFDFDSDGFKVFATFPEEGVDESFQLEFDLTKYLTEDYLYDMYDEYDDNDGYDDDDL